MALTVTSMHIYLLHILEIRRIEKENGVFNTSGGKHQASP
jgi:hypothetical protein